MMSKMIKCIHSLSRSIILITFLFSMASRANEVQATNTEQATRFQFQKWMLLSALKTAEDRRYYFANVDHEIPEGFDFEIQSRPGEVIRFSAMGQEVEATLHEKGHQLYLQFKGGDFEVSAERTFQESYEQIGNILAKSPPSEIIRKDHAVFRFFMPEAYAFLPLLAAIRVGIVAWAALAAGANECDSAHRPGDVDDSHISFVKNSILAPVLIFRNCLGQRGTVQNITCPRKPEDRKIKLQLNGNWSFEMLTDEGHGGKPIQFSLQEGGRKSPREQFGGECSMVLNPQESGVKIRNFRGAYPADTDQKTLQQILWGAAMYCKTGGKSGAPELYENLRPFARDLPPRSGH